jgi:phytoene/squalene synthetase
MQAQGPPYEPTTADNLFGRGFGQIGLSEQERNQINQSRGLAQLQVARDRFIKDMSKQIYKARKPLQPAETQIQSLPTRLLMRQAQINLMLNQQTDDLAYHRQIVPATRGVTKAVIYGN